jgi:hypothetical protein
LKGLARKCGLGFFTRSAPSTNMLLQVLLMLATTTAANPRSHVLFASHDRSSCPVTKPNGPWPTGQEPSGLAFGNRFLRVSLWPKGTVIFRPGGPGLILPDGSMSMKFGWWRNVRGKLTIQGRRLFTPGPPLRASVPEGYGDIGFQASAIVFPSEGCWEITGKVGKASLTIVTKVIREKN